MKTIKKEDNSKFLKILIYKKPKKGRVVLSYSLESLLFSPSYISLFYNTQNKIYFFSNVINIIFLETSIAFFDITTF